MKTPQALVDRWKNTASQLIQDVRGEPGGTKIYELESSALGDALDFMQELSITVKSDAQFIAIDAQWAGEGTYELILRALTYRLSNVLRAREADGWTSEEDAAVVDACLLNRSWGPLSELVLDSLLRSWAEFADAQKKHLWYFIGFMSVTPEERRSITLLCSRLAKVPRTIVIFPADLELELPPLGTPVLRVAVSSLSALETRTALESVLRDAVDRKQLTLPKPDLSRWANLIARISFPDWREPERLLTEFRVVLAQVAGHASANRLAASSFDTVTRLLFLFLLKRKFPKLFQAVSGLMDGEEALFRMQLKFLAASSSADPFLQQDKTLAEAPWKDLVETPQLESFFWRAMSGDEPLVHPFGSRTALSVHLWSDPTSVNRYRSAAAAQSLDWFKRTAEFFKPVELDVKEMRQLANEVVQENDATLSLETATTLLNAAEVRLGNPDQRHEVSSFLTETETLLQAVLADARRQQNKPIELEARILRVRLLGLTTVERGGWKPNSSPDDARLFGKAREELEKIASIALNRPIPTAPDKNTLRDIGRKLDVKAQVAIAYFYQYFGDAELAGDQWGQIRERAVDLRAEDSVLVASMNELAFLPRWETFGDFLRAEARRLNQEKRTIFGDGAPPDGKIGLFVSYNPLDKTAVSLFVDSLAANPYVAANVRIWRDEPSPERGSEWIRGLLNELETADFFLVFLSKSYQESRYCNIEYSLALIRTRVSKAKFLAIDIDDHSLIQHRSIQGPRERLVDPGQKTPNPRVLESELAKVLAAIC